MVNFNDKGQGMLFLSPCFHKLIESSPSQPRQTLCTFSQSLKHAYLFGHVYNVMKVDTRITYNYLLHSNQSQEVDLKRKETKF